MSRWLSFNIEPWKDLCYLNNFLCLALTGSSLVFFWTHHTFYNPWALTSFTHWSWLGKGMLVVVLTILRFFSGSWTQNMFGHVIKWLGKLGFPLSLSLGRPVSDRCDHNKHRYLLFYFVFVFKILKIVQSVKSNTALLRIDFGVMLCRFFYVGSVDACWRKKCV